MMPNERRPTPGIATLLLVVLAALQAGIYYHFARDPELKSHAPEFIAWSLVAGVLYLAAVYLVEQFRFGRLALAFILLAAVVFRVFLLPRPPAMSEDVYRYQWEGRVERRHLNPYTVTPATPGLESLQDPAHPQVTGYDMPTMYPALTVRSFALAETITGYKRLFTALDLASMLVILLLLARLKLPLERVLTYAWNPTVVVSFALGGHFDSLAILMLLLANLAIIAYRPLASAGFLALAFVSKFFPLLLVPVYWKQATKHRWAFAGTFGVVTVLAYVPFLSAGRGILGGFTRYAKEWEANDSAFRLIRHFQESRHQAELVAGVLLLGLLLYALRNRSLWHEPPPLKAGLFLTAGLLLLSPNAFPWYFTWSIPFLCFYPSAPWLLMTVLATLGYAPVVAYAAGQPYEHSPWILALEYVPVYVWLAVEAFRRLPAGPSFGLDGKGNAT